MDLRHSRAAAAYTQVAVTSRSPLELVVMLYDGAIASLSRAREAIVARDLVAKRDRLAHALAILDHLQSTLDMTSGGEIAANLDRLYAYATVQIMESSRTLDPAGLDEAIRILSGLREAWSQIAAAPQPEGAGAALP
ncbi:MAG: flagellar export chaperone FliS [Vicinamibacteraceae bacterium]|nr:flagellar export chaperone FliS [Vicinamibacteraceae bacterium]